MSLVRVLIATTEGPAEIRRLVGEEDSDLQSVVCLDGRTAQALPVSADYDAFVRKPTGVVERLVGHPVFRLDVARPVTSGRSWQLAALLGHLLLEAKRLAMRGEAAALVVLATGEVGADLSVLPVGHVAEKLRQAAPLLRQAQDDGAALLVLVPQGNAGDADPAPLAAAGIDMTRCPVVAVADMAAACQPLGLRLPGAAAAVKPKRRLVRTAGLALAAAVAAALAVQLSPREQPAEPAVVERPAETAPVLPAATRRPLRNDLERW